MFARVNQEPRTRNSSNVIRFFKFLIGHPIVTATYPQYPLP